MRVYIIHQQNESQSESHIYPPCIHEYFIAEIQKVYDLMTDPLLGQQEFFRAPEHQISEITTDFLLAQPTGRKIYLSGRHSRKCYLYFIAYEVMDDPAAPYNTDTRWLPKNTLLYHLCWRVRDLSWYTSEHPEIIESDPLKILLTVKHEISTCEGSDDECKCVNYLVSPFGYTYNLANLHTNGFIKLSDTRFPVSLSIQKCFILAHDAN